MLWHGSALSIDQERDVRCCPRRLVVGVTADLRTHERKLRMHELQLKNMQLRIVQEDCVQNDVCPAANSGVRKSVLEPQDANGSMRDR